MRAEWEMTCQDRADALGEVLLPIHAKERFSVLSAAEHQDHKRDYGTNNEHSFQNARQEHNPRGHKHTMLTDTRDGEQACRDDHRHF
jgi:hypothetical protein